MDGNGYININTDEIGNYLFKYLIREEGFCIDKELQDAIAYGVFDYLKMIGAVHEESDWE